MKSLIVGCSITHGSELVADVYHYDNPSYTYANLLSIDLGYQPNNLAIPGNSNERIFHDAVQNLDGHDLLMVGWTSLIRESWHDNNVDYFFNPNWACAIDDLTMSNVWTKDNPIKTVATDKNMLENLQYYHKFCMMYKSDKNQSLKKVQDYRRCLTSLCQARNIRFIDVCLLDHLFEDSYFFDTNKVCLGRHPDQTQHSYIKDQIKIFYNLC